MAVSEVTSRGLVLSWSSSSSLYYMSDVSHYVIEKRSRDGPWVGVANVSGEAGASGEEYKTSQLQYVIEGLQPNTHVTLRIRAVNEVGAGPPSQTLTVTTLQERK